MVVSIPVTEYIHSFRLPQRKGKNKVTLERKRA